MNEGSAISGDRHTAWCERKHDTAAECFATIGGSGHVQIALTLDEYGDVLIRVEQVDTGEIIDMDPATCGEIVPLLRNAASKAKQGQTWIDTGSGPGVVL